jgi:hypothetical protein
MNCSTAEMNPVAQVPAVFLVLPQHFEALRKKIN